jgi:hypothetical protein
VVGGETGGKVAGCPLPFADMLAFTLADALTPALALAFAFALPLTLVLALAFEGFASPLMNLAFALATVKAWARAALLIKLPFSFPVTVVV